LNRNLYHFLLFFLFALILAACSPEIPTPPPQPAVKEIIMATTTSTQDSGLLDLLVPDFEIKTGYIVQIIAVGTGKALEMGDQGNADVLLVHAPVAEKAIMDSGSGKDRLLVMHNDFIIVGPPDDPAVIKGAATAAEAFQKIAQAGAAFVSRGDDSGTHKMELGLWDKAGIFPEGDWYIESGQGMGATLKIASEEHAYILTDRATYLATQEGLDTDILVEGDPALLNVYHVITVNPEKWSKANYDGAIAFAKYMTSHEVQAMIAEFGVDKFGQPLFFPDANKTEDDLGLE